MFTGIRFTGRSFQSSDLYIKSKFSVPQNSRKKVVKNCLPQNSSTKLVPGAKKGWGLLLYFLEWVLYTNKVQSILYI